MNTSRFWLSQLKLKEIRISISATAKLIRISWKKRERTVKHGSQRIKVSPQAYR